MDEEYTPVGEPPQIGRMSSYLERIAAGDAHAVEECLDAYSGLVWTLARRMTRSTAAAEDAVQEIFISLWQSAAKYDPSKASEKTFIAMIARRRLIDGLRRVTRRPEVQMLEDAPDPSGRQHIDMELSVEAQSAAKLLDELRPEQRKVIELSVYEGLTHQEISEAVGMPLGTVKSHIFRGLAAVRRTLAESSDG